MSENPFQKIREEWEADDRASVDEYSNGFGSRGIESTISLLAWRLNRMGGALIQALLEMEKRDADARQP